MQEDLAARLRMTEAGEINLSLWALARIANALDVPMTAFLEHQA